MLCVTTHALSQAANAPETGSILGCWREVPGSTVEDLTSLPAYPNFPNEQLPLDRFEIPENQPGEFGTVIRGFIHPPQDGTYNFYIASTNEGQLWLGEADSAAEVAKTLVSHVPQWCAPRDWSACKQQPVVLKKGVSYYIEARHKNGGGDNHLAVAWKLPDGTLEGPIPGSRLSPARPVLIEPAKTILTEVPTTPGHTRVEVRVDYLTQRFTVPINVTLPDTYKPRQFCPTIVYIPDPDAAPALPATMPAEWRTHTT